MGENVTRDVNGFVGDAHSIRQQCIGFLRRPIRWAVVGRVFRELENFIKTREKLEIMEVCNGCENIVVSGTKFCPHCGSKIENIVDIREEKIAIEPLTENGINKEEKGLNRLYIAGSIGIITIIALYVLFSSAGPTYTLQYEVIATHEGEEFSLYYEYTTPEGETEGGIFVVVPGCDEATFCDHLFEVDFEYKEAFETHFQISCYGCEGDTPTVCIETLVDFYSIGLDCGFYSNPDDGLNFAIISDYAHVNRQVIDKVE